MCVETQANELCACGRPRLLGTGSPILYQSRARTKPTIPTFTPPPRTRGPAIATLTVLGSKSDRAIALLLPARANERPPFHLRNLWRRECVFSVPGLGAWEIWAVSLARRIVRGSHLCEFMSTFGWSGGLCVVGRMSRWGQCLQFVGIVVR